MTNHKWLLNNHNNAVDNGSHFGWFKNKNDCLSDDVTDKLSRNDFLEWNES